MKKSQYLILFQLFACKILLAQISYNFKGYSFGAGGGVATAFADVALHQNKPAFFANLSYNYSPFTAFTAEYQTGQLAGGSTVLDKDTRKFKNDFNAVVMYADIQAGELINYRFKPLLNVLKNFYAGMGVGVIHNHMAFIQRTSLIDPSYVFPGENSSTEMLLDFRAGYEFKFYNFYQEPAIRIRLGAESNLAYGEGLDGYNDPPAQFKNNKVDRYTIISVSVRYSFGKPVSYTKPIRGEY